jgi:hypothetical protein
MNARQRPLGCEQTSGESLHLILATPKPPVSMRSVDTPAWISASRTLLIRCWLRATLY